MGALLSSVSLSRVVFLSGVAAIAAAGYPLYERWIGAGSVSPAGAALCAAAAVAAIAAWRKSCAQEKRMADCVGQINAINRSQAVIEFSPDGTILRANENFLRTVGYGAEEIVGKHHRMFVSPQYAESREYKEFWEKLRSGQFNAGEFRRFGKNGKEIWLNAAYNPIFNRAGKPYKVVKYATDITAEKYAFADFSGQIQAIRKSQAVIEFTPDGVIVKANDNFLRAMGYEENEIIGKRHAMFVEPSYAASEEYRQFWEALRRGEFKQREFKRIAKGGREIWIQASYNPIFDPNGQICKVVKYATDVTAMVKARQENEHGAQETVRILKAMAAGDWTEQLRGNYEGAFKDIKTALNAMADRIVETITTIKVTAMTVNNAADEISAGSRDLSHRTEGQASTLEQTAASMERLTQIVRKNTENAQHARQLSSGAGETARQGGDVVGQAVEAMRLIQKSSEKISDIIGAIDEIAFQTNLLALNAAVEAARAGDAGKGFAVVAAEVRSLAKRSAQSSKEIKDLIHNSVRQIENGVDLANRSGKSLEEILSSIASVDRLINDIAGASREQSVGIEEINVAVSQMDEATQQNAAMVEESTAAAQSMNRQAADLSQLVEFFVVDKNAARNRA
ncbi:MAG: methyl-accepting chemotaxis protein [Rickettsiales bacterium]